MASRRRITKQRRQNKKVRRLTKHLRANGKLVNRHLRQQLRNNPR